MDELTIDMLPLNEEELAWGGGGETRILVY